MYKKIAVIGIGSLGGYVANYISNLEKINELILIDHDIIEDNNLKNTIYRKKDVGILKVDALENIIKNKNEDIIIKKINKKYIENVTKIPKYDILIDCRDYTYNRGKSIDTRLYISSRYLIIDCRRNVYYEKQHKGKYITYLTKNDLRNASIIFANLIDNNQIRDCILDQSVHKFDLDYLKKFIKRKKDIIYDSVPGEDQLINLANNILPILKANKTSKINMCVGTKDSPICEKIVPAKTLLNSNDIIFNLVSMINIPNCFNNYVISTTKFNKQFYVELIPETGAA